MKKLLVLVFVAAMCVPSYGEVLVYKTKQKGTTFSFNNWDDDYGRYQGQMADGFLLLDVDIDSGRILLINNSAFWITYTKTKTEGMSSMELRELEVYYGVWGAKTYMVISSFSFLDWINDSNDSSGNYVYGATITVEGVVKGTSLIKGGVKVSIPAALKGFSHFDWESVTKPELGSLTVIATLDKKWTARANDLNDLGGEDALLYTYLAIHSYLVDKGYPPLLW